MDWKLTKSLYIIVFLLMNIFLIYMYLSEYQEDVDEVSEAPDVLETTDIDTSAIEEYEPVEMNSLTATVQDFTQGDDQPVNSDDTENSNQISEEFEIDELTMDLNSLERYKNEEVYRGDEYRYDEVMSTGTQMVFNQTYEGSPIFNHESARLLFSGEGNSAETLEQTRLSDLEENEYTMPLEARSPLECIENLYQMERISDEAEVLNAQLGYYVILIEDDQAMLRPKWEFHISDQNVEKTIYVEATTDTGEIIESE